jgi:hypothetical protein
MAFALYEMKIVLAQAAVHGRVWSSPTAGPIRAVTRGFFIAPANGLPVRVKPRGRGRSGPLS